MQHILDAIICLPLLLLPCANIITVKLCSKETYLIKFKAVGILCSTVTGQWMSLYDVYPCHFIQYPAMTNTWQEHGHYKAVLQSFEPMQNCLNMRLEHETNFLENILHFIGNYCWNVKDNLFSCHRTKVILYQSGSVAFTFKIIV